MVSFVPPGATSGSNLSSLSHQIAHVISGNFRTLACQFRKASCNRLSRFASLPAAQCTMARKQDAHLGGDTFQAQSVVRCRSERGARSRSRSKLNEWPLSFKLTDVRVSAPIGTFGICLGSGQLKWRLESFGKECDALSVSSAIQPCRESVLARHRP